MRENLLYSIVVPVYNVEDYLEDCVNSILSQTYRHFELILVDDGSTDQSSEICDRYARENSAVSSIHQTNGGAAKARNTGIRAAKGDYLIFLDSDDFWGRDDALADIHQCILDNDYCDVVIFKGDKYDQNTSEIVSRNDHFTHEWIAGQPFIDQLRISVITNHLCACAWDLAINKRLYEEHDLFFYEGIVGEDIDWGARLILIVRSIGVVDQSLHMYRMNRSGAVTSKLTLKNLIDTKGSLERCLEYITDSPKDDELTYLYYSYVAYHYAIWMAESARVKNKKKKPLIQEMKQYTYLLKYQDYPKIKKVYLVYRIFGYTITSKILGLWTKTKGRVKITE